MGPASERWRSRVADFGKSLSSTDQILAAGTVSGTIGAALTAGIGAAFLFIALVCFVVVGLHVWAEVRE